VANLNNRRQLILKIYDKSNNIIFPTVNCPLTVRMLLPSFHTGCSCIMCYNVVEAVLYQDFSTGFCLTKLAKIKKSWSQKFHCCHHELINMLQQECILFLWSFNGLYTRM